MRGGRGRIRWGGPGFGPGASPPSRMWTCWGAEDAECPPGSGGGEDALLFVDDDGAVVGDAEGGHASGEGFGCGQHVGERCGVVGELF